MVSARQPGFLGAFALALLIGCGQARAPLYTGPTFDLQLVGAVHTDTVLRTSVEAVFAVTPKDMRDFPLGQNITASNCPYCDTPLVVKNATTSSIIKPRYLLPFKIERKGANECFVKWVRGLWFAPNKLKEYAQHSAEKLNGIYMPYWTYDTNTISQYRDMRGDHYYVTETYTDSQGKRQTRQVRKTRWTSASGTVYNKFDDVLIVASHSLPEKMAHDLGPWDLHELKAFNDKYLSGFVSESYRLQRRIRFSPFQHFNFFGA